MIIVSFHTHGPWQQERFLDEDGVIATTRAAELAESYGEVKIERRSSMKEWKNGVPGEWHDD